MLTPHGGKLVDRYEVGAGSLDFDDATVLQIKDDTAEDVENIAHGVFSPLQGFLCRNDLDSVMENMRLEDDTPLGLYPYYWMSIKKP